MGIAIHCAGCGQALQVPDDSRSEIECLWCGKMTSVPRPPPASPVQAAPALAGHPDADDILPADDLPLAPVQRSADPSTPENQGRGRTRWHEQEPYSFQEGQSPLAASASTPTPPALPVARPVADEDEDAGPYQFDGRQDRPCPECGRSLAYNVVLCPSCGYDLKSGKKLKRTYGPINRSWESGWPLSVRKKLFFAGQFFAVPLSLVGAFSGGGTFGFFGPWILFTMMTAYLLGTFNRVELAHTKKGKVTLKQTWWVFFLEQPTRPILLSEYDGVTSGKIYRTDFWDWLVTAVWAGSGVLWGLAIALPLLILGLVMAGLWWYYFVNQETYYVALTKDHGHPALNLYRGWSQETMQDMAATVKDIAFTSFL